MLFQLIISVAMTVLAFTAYFMMCSADKQRKRGGDADRRLEAADR